MISSLFSRHCPWAVVLPGEVAPASLKGVQRVECAQQWQEVGRYLLFLLYLGRYPPPKKGRHPVGEWIFMTHDDKTL